MHHTPANGPGGPADRLPSEIPLVGREREIADLEGFLEAESGSVSAVFLRGESGSGKSRLAAELLARAERRGWASTRGRAYPVEQGIPFALFADAFLPLLRTMDPDTLTVLSRGGDAELRLLFPALAGGPESGGPPSGVDPEEFRTRLFWNFAEFLGNLAQRKPLFVVLEDLHWADASSLELLHFLVRQAGGHGLFFLCTYSEADRERGKQLVTMERSLHSLGVARSIHLEPLTPAEVEEMVSRTFSVDPALVREFSAMLFGWTQGNPFFIEEVLKSLVAHGRLRSQGGSWVGWEATDFALPGSIRDAVLARLASFSAEGRKTLELAAVIGTRAPYPLLASISGLSEDELLHALEELCAHRVLVEFDSGGAVVYDFLHPLVRETLYREFGLQRSRMLHATVAEAMEAYWGSEALAHADELAHHFARSDASHLAAKALKYLGAAGKGALARHADREAVGYLRAALERAKRLGDAGAAAALESDLARAHQRLGGYEEAAALWDQVVSRTVPGTAEHAAALRQSGLATFWCGRRDQAFDRFTEGIEAADAAGDGAERVHLLLVRGHCLQELGHAAEAREDIEAALKEAQKLKKAQLLARVHRALALLHVWTGPPAEADRHAVEAIALARRTGDLSVEFWACWGLAVLWGMTGDTEKMREGIAEATRIADELRSPVLRLWTAEMSIELAYATGDWDGGLAMGAQSIALARRLNQKALLPRLLAWTSLIHVGRGEMERARVLVDEACGISGMHDPGGAKDVHLVIPAYISLAHFQLGLGEYREAIDTARRGLEIAEGTGYTLWAVHRLLPILGEAHLWAEDVDGAERAARRLREHASALDHKLGIAWADACDAMVRWKRGDPEGGAQAMRRAAEALEKVPMIPYAVRIRRQLAGRLAEIGELEGSVAELRTVHDVFVRLGAERELDKTRIQFREVGHRPPPRGAGAGIAGLTERELEIAKLVAERKSNKAIGKDLAISPRTVSTHLSNIFQKVDVPSRTALGDLVRSLGLLDD